MLIWKPFLPCTLCTFCWEGRPLFEPALPFTPSLPAPPGRVGAPVVHSTSSLLPSHCQEGGHPNLWYQNFHLCDRAFGPKLDLEFLNPDFARQSSLVHYSFVLKPRTHPPLPEAWLPEFQSRCDGQVPGVPGVKLDSSCPLPKGDSRAPLALGEPG